MDNSSHLMLPDVKPCPYCGGQAMLCITGPTRPRELSKRYIMCSGCGIQTYRRIVGGISGRTEEEVISDLKRAWNERRSNDYE